ncbi:MAG: hypothetical protein JW934_03410 [Anaerolineae bacterium]|nr:hypothetical protein [Anaerolineae bacterium]
MNTLFGIDIAWVLLIGVVLALVVWSLWRWLGRRRRHHTPADPSPYRTAAAETEANWTAWKTSIRNALMQYGWVESYFLSSIPLPLHAAAMRRYVQENTGDALIFQEEPLRIELANRERMRLFLHSWKAAWELTESENSFNSVVAEIAAQLCNMLGFVRVQEEQRIFHSLHAFMVRAPALRLKVPPRFPIIFVRRREGNRDDVADLRSLMSILNVTSYFALIIDLNDFADRLDPSKNLKYLAREMIHDFIVLNGHDLRQIVVARDSGRRLVELMLQQVDLTVVSPYVTSGPVPDNMFFGRDYELKTIVRKIEETSFAVVGGRKIGKTSILAKVYRLLSEDDAHRDTRYLDCQAVTHYEAFFEAAKINWDIQLPIDAPEAFGQCIARNHSRPEAAPIVILLDEVDSLLEYDAQHGHALFRVFRALSQENHARFVFCGERTLYDQLHDGRSPLFNFGDTVQLGALTESAARRIILEPMQTMGISIQEQEEMVYEIIDLASCHPNIVQYLCQQLILEANTRRARLITPVDLQTVRHSSRFHEYFLSVTWGNTGPLERVITLLVAGHDTLSFGDLEGILAERGFAVPQSTLEQAISGLRLYGILIKVGQTYRFTSQVFAEVIQESQEVDILLTSLRNQLRDQAEREGWRPTW